MMKKIIFVAAIILFISLPVLADTDVASCQNLNASGTYFLDNNFYTNGNSNCFNVTSDNIIFDCHGYMISDSVYSGEGSGTFFSLGGNSNFTLQNCVLNQQVNLQFFNFQNFNGINIINNTFEGTTGKNIVNLTDDRNVYLKSNKFSQTFLSSYSDIEFERVRNMTVTNNTFTSNKDGIWSGGGLSRSVYITNNSMSISGNCFVTSGWDGSTTFDDAVIANNTGCSDLINNPWTHVSSCQDLTSGSYILDNDLVHNSGTNYYCLGLNEDNITIDCQDYSISGDLMSAAFWDNGGDNGYNYTIKYCNVENESIGIDSEGENLYVESTVFHNIDYDGIDSSYEPLTLSNVSFYDLRGTPVYSKFNSLSQCIGNFSNVTAFNLPIEFYNSTVSIQNRSLYEILLCNANNSIIDNVTFQNTYVPMKLPLSVDVADTWGSSIEFYSDNVTVNNSNFMNVQVLGFGDMNASLVNSNFTNSSYSLVNIGGFPISTETIDNSDARSCNKLYVDEVYEDGIPFVYKNQSNVSINGGNYSGIILCNSSNSSITNSNVLGSVYATHSKNLTINNDSIGAKSYGFEQDAVCGFYDSNNMSVTNSSITSDLTQINLKNTANATISGNTILSRNPYFAIIALSASPFRLSNATNIYVYNNKITSPNSNYFKTQSSTLSLNATLQSGTNIVGRSLIGGNYYTDLTSHGYSDICLDSNNTGICDSAFTIDGFTDYLPLSSNTTLSWSENQSSLPASYSPSQYSTFNVTWSGIDYNGYTFSYVETNYSGSPHNYTTTRIDNQSTYQIILPVGTFYFKFYANDSMNRWNSTDEWYFTVNQTTPSLSVSANPAWSANYPTSTTVSGSGCPSEITCDLYRDVYLVPNSSETQILAVGSYIYVYNTSGDENYTSASISKTLIILQAGGNTVTPSGGGGGGGGGGSFSLKINQTNNTNSTKKACLESWKCTDWFGCMNGTQIRTCKDSNNCGTTYSEPIELQQCNETPSPTNITAYASASSTNVLSLLPVLYHTIVPFVPEIVIVLAATTAIIAIIEARRKRLRKRTLRQIE